MSKTIKDKLAGAVASDLLKFCGRAADALFGVAQERAETIVSSFAQKRDDIKAQLEAELGGSASPTIVEEPTNVTPIKPASKGR